MENNTTELEIEQPSINIDDKIQEWIERGEKIIYPQNYKDWTNCVKNRAHDSYNGLDLECALQIMEFIENDTDFYDIEETLNKSNFSESAHYLILRIILAFSKHGPDFMEYITRENLPEDLKQAIVSQREENEKFEIDNSQETNDITSTEIPTNTESEPIDVNVSLAVVKKQSIFARIINFIKKLFKPKHKLLDSNENIHK